MENQRRPLWEDAISIHYPNFGCLCPNPGKFSRLDLIPQLTGKGYSQMKVDHSPLITEARDMDVARVVAL